MRRRKWPQRYRGGKADRLAIICAAIDRESGFRMQSSVDRGRVMVRVGDEVIEYDGGLRGIGEFVRRYQG